MPSGPDAKVYVAAGTAIGSVFAVLLALGIQGDALYRLIRDYTWQMAALLGAAIVIAGLALVLSDVFKAFPQKLKRFEPWAQVGVTLAAIVIAVIAVLTGVAALNDRSSPSITVTTVSADDELATVRVGASGSYMQSKDRLLLRIAAVNVTGEAARRSCFNAGEAEPSEGVEIEELFWGEAVPLANGTATRTTTVKVRPTETRYLCIWSAFSLRQGDEEGLYSGVLMDLRSAAAANTEGEVEVVVPPDSATGEHGGEQDDDTSTPPDSGL